ITPTDIGPNAGGVPGKFPPKLPYHRPNAVHVGARVKVTLGNKPLTGVVLEHSPAPSNVKLKNIVEVLDDKPLLDQASLSLLNWAANYYAHPLGDCVCSSLPTVLSNGEPAELTVTELYQQAELDADSLSKLEQSRAKQQVALYKALPQTGGLSKAQIKERGHKTTALKTLLEKGLAKAIEEQIQCPQNTKPSAGPALTDEQTEAVAQINQVSNQHQCFVLEGVTGSGKTEVYLQAAAHCLAQEKSVLILVPEIGLTPQFLNRVQQRLPAAITVLHSGLNAKDRKDNWLFAQRGQAKVIIGTRSAIFTPIPNLGLIVVDEEHDAAFKQQDQMRYHARDLAVVRAHQTQIPVVLGSATPASETLANIQRGQYKRLQLTQRATGQRVPSIAAIDLRSQTLKDYLSQTLINKIKQHTDAGNQALLFLNRRGVAPVLLCHECGWSADCHSCDSRMTLHRGQYRDMLRCHHCDASRKAPQQCGSCGSSNLLSAGAGTAGLEETLTQLFPDKTILRVDRDNTRTASALHSALDKAAKGKADILVGTQMLAKGHHFPKLTLVGIVDADAGLYSSDYRAAERLAQQVVQVAGRAGREAPGEVLIQTHMPEHPVLETLLKNGYDKAISALLEERQAALMPPYSHMALIRVSHTRADRAEAFARAVGHFAGQFSQQANIMGPITAPMPKKANRWHFQVLIQTQTRSERSQLLAQLVPAADQHKLASGVRWSVDVDPLDLF
ncbi:MAG: primosomal protein N', partial [Gammaproteobacteria bacterium]|nr:primosomal protein N' [Gammaproteobacteria bacterium]